MTNKVEVIAFSAEWCNPCKQYAPVFEAVSLNLSGPDVKFRKVNIDADPDVAAEYQVRGIPTTIVLKDGEKVAHQAGVLTADQLTALIK